MNLSDNSKINGLITGLLRGQYDRVDELNTRILGRFVPDQQLQPNFDARPISTKYSHFPIIESKTKAKIPILQKPEYSTNVFAPITTRGPVDGFLSNVNIESELRNQYNAIQKGGSQGVYVPCSRSDLYNIVVPTTTNPIEQPHKGLFKPPPTCKTTKPHLGSNIGSQQFFNNTRIQMRGGELV
jgi:hypothetical protein